MVYARLMATWPAQGGEAAPASHVRWRAHPADAPAGTYHWRARHSPRPSIGRRGGRTWRVEDELAHSSIRPAGIPWAAAARLWGQASSPTMFGAASGCGQLDIWRCIASVSLRIAIAERCATACTRTGALSRSRGGITPSILSIASMIAPAIAGNARSRGLTRQRAPPPGFGARGEAVPPRL